MLRNFVLLGLVAGAFASIPLIYEQNQDSVLAALRGLLDEQARRENAVPAVAAQPAPPKTAVLSGGKVRIPADERGHYRATFRLNGRQMDALVDTGATFVALNTAAARRIGLQLSPSDFRYRVETANGTAAAARAVIDSLEIGQIRMREVPAVVLEDTALRGTLIGMSFLGRLARFKMEDGELLLEQ